MNEALLAGDSVIINEEPLVTSISWYKKTQNFVWDLLNSHKGLLSKIVNITLILFLLASLLGFVLSTDRRAMRYQWLATSISVIEILCMISFTTEFILLLWSCIAENSRFNRYGPIKGRLIFLISVDALIDLVSMLPSYIYYIILLAHSGGGAETVNLTFLNDLVVLRFFRLFRLIKAEKYFNSFEMIRKVVWKRRSELTTAAFIVFLTTIVVSTLLYYAEKGRNPGFASIPRCIYWSIITLSTVGYGDVVPQTLAGKMVACACALCAVSVFAIPTSILASGVMQELEKSKLNGNARDLTDNHEMVIIDNEKKLGKFRIVNHFGGTYVCPYCKKCSNFEFNMTLHKDY